MVEVAADFNLVNEILHHLLDLQLEQVICGSARVRVPLRQLQHFDRDVTPAPGRFVDNSVRPCSERVRLPPVRTPADQKTYPSIRTEGTVHTQAVRKHIPGGSVACGGGLLFVDLRRYVRPWLQLANVIRREHHRQFCNHKQHVKRHP